MTELSCPICFSELLFKIENIFFAILSLIESHICLTTDLIYSQNKILDHVLESLIKSGTQMKEL